MSKTVQQTMGRAWAIRNTESQEWYTRTPWLDGTDEVVWSPDFSKASIQMGEGYRDEFYKQAEWLRSRGHQVEVVRLGFVEDPYRFGS